MYTPDDLRAIAARVHHAEAEAALEWAAKHIQNLEIERAAWERQTRSLADAFVVGLAGRNVLAAELAAARAVVDVAAASLDATRPIKDRQIALHRALDDYFASARRA